MMQPEPQVAPFSLQPMTPTIGAVVDGADLAAPDPGLCAALKDALLRWKVLFFYDNHIDTAQQVAFARHFGALETNPVLPHAPGFPEVAVITHDRDHRGDQNIWHSDATWRPDPSSGSILRAVEVPVAGGDTLFADMGAAYDGLPPRLKAQIEGRTAMHEMGYLRLMIRKAGKGAAERDETLRKYPPVEHPIVRTHPRTGRKILFANAVFTRRIVGMEPDESADLLKDLCAHAAIPEYQCRFRWRQGAIAFWDNCATQHYAVSDYWPAVRRMERVSIVGDRPC
jgi:taurine dioxygenase